MVEHNDTLPAQLTSLVQPIVVRPSTHFDTVAACAIASGLAMVQANLRSDPWHSWLGGSFTKSVRRVKKAAEFERVRVLDPLSAHSAAMTVGDAVAIAFAPQRYD